MDEKVAPRKKEIQKKMENDKWQLEKYLIVLTNHPQNHLEIFQSALLIQKAIQREILFVGGIASGYEEALELVEKIVQEVYDETNETDIRKYILEKQQEYEEGNV